jgi:hypothetical protein
LSAGRLLISGAFRAFMHLVMFSTHTYDAIRFVAATLTAANTTTAAAAAAAVAIVVLRKRRLTV